MGFNYFALLCFIWAIIGLCSRVVIKKLGVRWKDWEEYCAYPEAKPKWLLPVDLLAVALIALTWYMVAASEVRKAWIIAVLMTLVVLKAMAQMFKYNEFRAFVKKALADDKLFAKINTSVTVFSLCLIGLGIYYML